MLGVSAMLVPERFGQIITIFPQIWIHLGPATRAPISGAGMSLNGLRREGGIAGFLKRSTALLSCQIRQGIARAVMAEETCCGFRRGRKRKRGHGGNIFTTRIVGRRVRVPDSLIAARYSNDSTQEQTLDERDANANIRICELGRCKRHLRLKRIPSAILNDIWVL